MLIFLALTFQGSRGLWGTDEGRYVAVALRMLENSDYLFPSLNDGQPHFTKPPLTYWTIAASMRAFGHTEWAARLPNALAFIATGLLIYGLGLRVVPRRPWLPAIIYATSLGPFAAANIVTTDTLLTLWETLAVFAYMTAWFSDDARDRRRYLLLMWCGFGLAFATKGPPGLLPLLPMLALRWLSPFSSPPLVNWPGLAAFVAIGLGWYAAVIGARPELLSYFLGYEVYDRLFTSVHDRNAEWYGAIHVYGIAFVVGTLPWLAFMLRPLLVSWRLATRASWRAWRADPPGLFLLLWLLAPLMVLCLARSRLPLYVLPLSAPVALLLGRRLEHSPWIKARWAPAALVLLVLALTGIKWGAAEFPYHKDSRALAWQISAHLPNGGVEKIIFLNTWAHYGLDLYLNAEVEEATLTPPVRLCTKLHEPGDSIFVMPVEYARAVHGLAATCGHYAVREWFAWRGLDFMTISAASAPEIRTDPVAVSARKTNK